MAAELTAEQREVIGQAWHVRMEQESLAVSMFARLTIELANFGCDPVVLEICARGAADEIRHAGVCRDLARHWLGHDRVPDYYTGILRNEPPPDFTREQALALDMAEISCMSETMFVAIFTRILEVAGDPTRSKVADHLYADEVNHGRMGWLYLAGLRARGKPIDYIGPELVGMLDRQIAPAIVDAPPDDPAFAPNGHLGPRAKADVYREGLAKVILPGFDALGIDTTAARAHAKARGWI